MPAPTDSLWPDELPSLTGAEWQAADEILVHRKVGDARTTSRLTRAELEAVLLGTSAAGRALIAAADASAQRSLLGLGSAATRNVGTTAGTVAAGDDARLTDPRTPTAHVHSIADVTGLEGALASKAASAHGHAISEVSGLAAEISAAERHAWAGVWETATAYTRGDIVRVMAPSDPGERGLFRCTVAHTSGGATRPGQVAIGTPPDPWWTDVWTQIRDNELIPLDQLEPGDIGRVLVIDPDGNPAWLALTAADVGAAEASHTHGISDVTGLGSALAGKAATSHTHAIADVTGLQTALDGKSVTGHGHAIADVSGLQAALDGKAASSHTHTASQISDSTAAGRTLLSAADAAAQRTALGLGDAAQRNIGTTAGTAAAGDDPRFGAGGASGLPIIGDSASWWNGPNALRYFGLGRLNNSNELRPFAVDAQGGTIANANATTPDQVGSLGRLILRTANTSQRPGAYGIFNNNGPRGLYFANDSGHRYFTVFAFSVTNLSDGTDTFEVQVGFNDEFIRWLGSREAVWRYIHSTNSGQWTCYSAGGTSGTETHNSSIAVTAGSLVTLGVEWDGRTGHNCFRFYDLTSGTPTLIYTTTSAITYSGQDMGCVISQVRTAGTATREVAVAWAFLAIDATELQS